MVTKKAENGKMKEKENDFICSFEAIVVTLHRFYEIKA